MMQILKSALHLVLLALPVKLQSLFSDEFLLSSRFLHKFGRLINFDNPTTFNEKIQWIKLYEKNPLMTQCADKYAVREFVEEKVGKGVLNELYGVYEDAEEIDFDLLPDSFVLKATHGSGWNIIIKEKKQFNVREVIKTLDKWMATNYHTRRREWAYKHIPPKIVAEKYIEDKNGLLLDYKFFCFNGTPSFIQVDIDRYKQHKRVFYNSKWERFDFEFQHPIYEQEVKPPDSLGEMVEIVKTLSSDFLFARIDLYDLDRRPVFGEITFYPEAGFGKFKPEEWDAKFGNLLKLPV